MAEKIFQWYYSDALNADLEHGENVLVKRMTKSEGYPAIATRKPAATIGQVMSRKIKRLMYT